MDIAQITQQATTRWEIASGTTLLSCWGSVNLSGEWHPKHVSRRLAQLSDPPYADQLILHTLSQSVNPLAAWLSRTGAGEFARSALRELQKILAQPEVVQLIAGMNTLIRQTLLRLRDGHLTAQDESLLALRPVEVLLDAETAFPLLKKITVSTGTAGDVVHYSKTIVQANTVAQLYAALPMMPQGFTLCGIRANEPTDSYFVLVFKSGENIYLISDQPGRSDPLQSARLSQRNQRFNAQRMQESHWPYELFGIHWDEQSRYAQSYDTLPASSSSLQTLGTLSELRSSTLIFLSHLAQRCVEHFVEAQQIAPQAALLLPPAERPSTTLHPLLAKRASEIVPGIVLPSLGALTRGQFVQHYPSAQRRGGRNQWMEKRFRHDTPEEAIYPHEHTTHCLLPGERHLALPGHGTQVQRRICLPTEANLTPLPADRLHTEEEAVACAVYIGRHNQAAIAETLAQQDYIKRREGVMAWVYRHIIKHLPTLLPALTALDHDAVSLLRHDGALAELGANQVAVRQVHFVKLTSRYIKRRNDTSELIRRAGLYANHGALCYISKTRYQEEVHADHVFVLNLSTIFDLMTATGLPRSAFPDCLQQFGLPNRLGNTLLETHDPFDLISDPWQQLPFTFALPVYRKAVNQYRRENGLKAIRPAGALPHHWHDTPEANALCDSLRIHGYTSTRCREVPEYMQHLLSERYRASRHSTLTRHFSPDF